MSFAFTSILQFFRECGEIVCTAFVIDSLVGVVS